MCLELWYNLCGVKVQILCYNSMKIGLEDQKLK